MTNLIIIAVLLVIVGGAVAYIVKAKKSGVECIGCPSSASCSHKNGDKSSASCGCSCGCGNCGASNENQH